MQQIPCAYIHLQTYVLASKTEQSDSREQSGKHLCILSHPETQRDDRRVRDAERRREGALLLHDECEQDHLK